MIASDRLFGTSISRWLAVFAAALLALTLLPATTAIGQEVDDPEDACPEDPPPAPYTDRGDIPEVHVRNVDCVTHRNIALGFADNTYRPTLPVPRDQMASFIARTLDEAGFMLPGGGPPPEFDDIAGNTHEENINRLARAGIVLGGPGDLSASSYGPRLLVRRDQMASFLIRAAEWALDQSFGESDQRFPDVPAGNPHFQNVNGAHETGLTVGRVDGTYGPADSTRRDQMASFLARLLNFLETFEPEPEPTPEPTPEPPIETFTNAPELIGAEHVRTTSAGHVDVRFTFRAGNPDQIRIVEDQDGMAPGFHLHTFNGENFFADDASLESPTSVLTRFEDFEDTFLTVTIAAVDADQVGTEDDEGDVGGLTNPEGAVPIEHNPHTHPGRMHIRAGLVEVQNVRVANDITHGWHVRANMVWDRDVDEDLVEDNILVLDDAETWAEGDTTISGDGNSTHVVAFNTWCTPACGAIADQATAELVRDQTRRAFVDSSAVLAGFFSNRAQTVDIAQDGQTEGPDLVDVILRPGEGSDLVDYVFSDDLVDSCTASEFRLRYWDGSSNTGNDCDVDDNVVTVEYDDDDISDFLAYAIVEWGAVESDDTGFENLPDSQRFAMPIGPGDTAAPVLVSVDVDEDLNVTFGFNQDVFMLSEFAVYDIDGERTVLTDCTAADDEVVCEPSGLGEEQAVQNAVLAGYASESIESEDSPVGASPSFPESHADSEPVTHE